MQLNLFFALVGGLWFWFAASLAGYSWIQTLKSPIVVGTVLGALTGNLETGLITGGSIEMVYLGMVAAGGNIPSDRVFAALIAVPIAIQTGVTPEVAVSIAVPLGVLGVFVNNLRRTVNAVFVHWADKAADEADVKKVWRCATTYPLILGFIIRFPMMFVINYFGADFVTAMLNVMPTWLLTGFNVMGGMLPALGFATTIFMIGKMKYLPLFIIGFSPGSSLMRSSSTMMRFPSRSTTGRSAAKYSGTMSMFSRWMYCQMSFSVQLDSGNTRMLSPL